MKTLIKIGLEIHTQLNLKTKLFCGCSVPKEDSAPNTHVCEICLGMPGAKPRVNRSAVDAGMRIALALNAHFPKSMFFSRKVYFYPDMSKNYQTTQYEIPLCENGYLEHPSLKKKIRIKRVHLEEDPAKIVHVGGNISTAQYTLLDYNRAGLTLAEIVTEPDFDDPKQVRIFLQYLTTILEYLGVFDMATGTLKADVNISVNPEGGEGTRVEIKNMSGLKDIETALNYEIIRQTEMLERGTAVKKETRAYDPESRTTRALRSKESEEEYGYITDPDLTEITLDAKHIGKIKESMPEMPMQKMERFIDDFGIEKELAESIVTEIDLANAFEHAASFDGKLAARYYAGPIKKILNFNNMRFSTSKFTQDSILDILKLVKSGKITDKTAEEALREMALKGGSAQEYTKDAEKIADTSSIELIVDNVVNRNQKAVDDYKAGNMKSIEFLVGQVMRESRGRADIPTVRTILEKKLQ